MRLNKKCFPRVASSFSFCSFDELAGLSDSELSFDGFSSLEHAFPSDEVGDTFDEDVNEGSLRLSESIGVGDIPSSTNRGGVDTSDTTGLEGEGRADLLEVFSSGEVGELNHGSGSESSSEVGGAGEDETEMKSYPLAWRTSLMALVELANLTKMALMLSPFSMEMILM